MKTRSSSVLWEVFVPGKPAPQGSKHSYGRGRMVESSKAVGPWRERVAYFALQARHVCPPVERLTPVALRVEFVMPRPLSASKRSSPPAIRQPDLDKCLRAVGDALTGIAYVDDAQVVSIVTVKRIAELGEVSGCHIRVGVTT